MVPIRRVLVPLDGSVTAESILPHVRRVAMSLGSSVRLLHTLEHGRAGGLTRDSVEWRLHMAEARSYLEHVAERFQEAGLDVDTVVVEGRPARQTIFESRRWEADLIALSSHGHGGADGFNLGGIAQKILAHAGVSILLARAGPPPEEDTPEAGSYGLVILPVDLSLRSDWALSVGTRIARFGGSAIELVHVVSVPEVPERRPGDFVARACRRRLIDMHYEMAQHHLKAIEEQLTSPGLTVRSRLLESASVSRALVEATDTVGDGLHVVSAHGVSGPSPWPYGSVTNHLIAHGTLPILVLQDVPRAMPIRSASESASTRFSVVPTAPWNN